MPNLEIFITEFRGMPDLITTALNSLSGYQNEKVASMWTQWLTEV